MKNLIVDYLETKQRELEHSPSPTSRFALPAVQRLLSSKALLDKDWSTFQRLITQSIAVNNAEANLAEEFPDVFHPNVAKSRREENLLFEEVLQLMANEATLERSA